MARTFTAKYRDGSGIVREKATGCRDKEAARAVLGELEKRAEKVRSGINTAAEDSTSDHQRTALVEHITAFIDHQRARGLSRRVNDTQRQLCRVATECGWGRLTDLDAPTLERWLLDQAADRMVDETTGETTAGMAAGTRNQYRSAWVAFGNWCCRNRRLTSNPFSSIPKADEAADRRRTRRSLTERELLLLLDVARRRPLLDRMTVRKGPRKGEVYGKLRPEVHRRLERLGRERALIYKTDLRMAGIPKRDQRGRTVDVHAIRHSFGTLLSKGGVAPWTAQAALRHWSIDLTMNVYTDPALLDVAGALESLPSLPLTWETESATNALSATDTDDWRASEFAPKFAPNSDKRSVLQPIADKKASETEKTGEADPLAVTSYQDKRKDPLTTPANGPSKWAAADSNRRLPPCEDGALTN